MRLPESVESEIVSWTDGNGPRLPSPTLARVLLMALGEPVEFLDDVFDLDSPKPRRLRIRNTVYVEQKE